MLLKHLILIALIAQLAYAAKKQAETTKAPVNAHHSAASRSLNLFPNILSFFGLNRSSQKNQGGQHVYTVLKVSDGDTITVKNKTSNQLVKIRFL
jgi:endonuclease YncB( thermonuclease family)